MAFQSFVSLEYLSSFTPISRNIDVNEITPHLQSTELMWSRELIGKNLYDDLKDKFSAQTLNNDEVVLVGYLKQHIAYRASEMAIPFLNIKIKSKGAVKLKGDYEEPASLGDMKYLREELKNRAEYYEQLIKTYLCKNSSLFPLYLGTNDLIEPITSTSYDSDIYLDDYYDDYVKRNKYYYGNSAGNNF